MADAPQRADHGGVLDATLAANDGGNGDNMIGVGGMAHPEKEAQHDNGEKSDHRLIRWLQRHVRPGRLLLKIRIICRTRGVVAVSRHQYVVPRTSWRGDHENSS